MKGFINNIKKKVIDNLIDNASIINITDEITKHITWWVMIKWSMAVELPLIVMPLFGISYSPKISKMCYWIGGMLGVIIVERIICLVIDYLIGICLRHKRECANE